MKVKERFLNKIITAPNGDKIPLNDRMTDANLKKCLNFGLTKYFDNVPKRTVGKVVLKNVAQGKNEAEKYKAQAKVEKERADTTESKLAELQKKIDKLEAKKK